MNILNYIKSLLTRLSKDTIMEDIRITKGELQLGVIPAYDAADKYFSTSKLKSEAVLDLSNVFYRNYNGIKTRGGRTNIISTVNSVISNVLDNLNTVDTQLDDTLEHDVIKDGLTAKKAILIRAAEHISFISGYSIDLLNYIYYHESLSLLPKDNDNDSENVLTKAQIDYVETNIIAFAGVLSTYGIVNSEFVELLDKVPDVILNIKTAGPLSSVYSEKSIDPYGNYLISHFDSSPIYHIRLAIVEWQSRRYKLFKDKKRMLELRLLHLKMINEDNPDPKVEYEINYIQNRIEGLEYKMKKIEGTV